MKHLPLFASLSLFFLAMSCGETSNPNLLYTELIERMQAGDTTVDYLKVREAMASSKFYDPFAFSPSEGAMMDALTENDYEKAIQEAEHVLNRNYLSFHAHYISAKAYEALDDTAKVLSHGFILAGLIRSITDANDGTSIETAYKLISPEEQSIVMLVRGYVPVEGSNEKFLDQETGNYVAMMYKNLLTKEERMFYFDLTRAVQHNQ